MEIKERIRQIRKSRNLSQVAFAEMIECTKSQVAQWEVGNNYPKLENLIKISKVFQVSTDWILMGVTPVPTDSLSELSANHDAAVWKDNHIAYLKERIRELEKREQASTNLKENLEGLQEFVLEQLSKIGGKNYQELRTALGDKLGTTLEVPRKYSILRHTSREYKILSYK